MLDADEAGRAAAEKIHKKLHEGTEHCHLNITRRFPMVGKDFNDELVARVSASAAKGSKRANITQPGSQSKKSEPQTQRKSKNQLYAR